MIEKIKELLGDEADNLLNHESKTISKDLIHCPVLILLTEFGQTLTGHQMYFGICS